MTNFNGLVNDLKEISDQLTDTQADIQNSDPTEQVRKEYQEKAVKLLNRALAAIDEACEYLKEEVKS